MQNVNVMYKYVDGAHFFVSDDEASTGLCVAHTEPAKAFIAVSMALTKLFAENHGEKNVEFVPSINLQAFLQWFTTKRDDAMKQPTPGTAGVFPWARKHAELAEVV